MRIAAALSLIVALAACGGGGGGGASATYDEIEVAGTVTIPSSQQARTDQFTSMAWMGGHVNLCRIENNVLSAVPGVPTVLTDARGVFELTINRSMASAYRQVYVCVKEPTADSYQLYAAGLCASQANQIILLDALDQFKAANPSLDLDLRTWADDVFGYFYRAVSLTYSNWTLFRDWIRSYAPGVAYNDVVSWGMNFTPASMPDPAGSDGGEGEPPSGDGEGETPSGDGGAVPPTTPGFDGSWSGWWTVTAPPPCAGYDGTWSATFTVTNNVISGVYTSSAGYSGTVSGTQSGGAVNWSVGGGGGGISFAGTISGNSVSGTWSGGEECYGGSGATSGSFGGSRG
ncbi:MAG: hypothetical protein HY804_04655 [Nitrospinae bacterium]|nr:hypothetical protein [Nitrospinota bacterium]